MPSVDHDHIGAPQLCQLRRVSEGINMASGAMLAVAEAAQANGALPANQAAAGYTSPSTSNVSSIAIAGDGTGTITLTTTAIAGGGTVIFTPTYSNTGVVWTCAPGTLAARYLPSMCH